MALQDALDAALDSVPDCKVVSYIDIASGLVLRKAVDAPVAQEILDRSAAVAQALWQGGSLAGFTGDHLGVTDLSEGVFVVKAPRQTYLFARTPKYDDHAICFRCGTEVLPEDLLNAAKPTIKAIADAF